MRAEKVRTVQKKRLAKKESRRQRKIRAEVAAVNVPHTVPQQKDPAAEENPILAKSLLALRLVCLAGLPILPALALPVGRPRPPVTWLCFLTVEYLGVIRNMNTNFVDRIPTLLDPIRPVGNAFLLSREGKHHLVSPVTGYVRELLLSCNACAWNLATTSVQPRRSTITT